MHFAENPNWLIVEVCHSIVELKRISDVGKTIKLGNERGQNKNSRYERVKYYYYRVTLK